MKKELSDDDLKNVSGGLQPAEGPEAPCPVGCKPDPAKGLPGTGQRPDTVADSPGTVTIGRD